MDKSSFDKVNLAHLITRIIAIELCRVHWASAVTSVTWITVITINLNTQTKFLILPVYQYWVNKDLLSLGTCSELHPWEVGLKMKESSRSALQNLWFHIPLPSAPSNATWCLHFSESLENHTKWFLPSKADSFGTVLGFSKPPANPALPLP